MIPDGSDKQDAHGDEEGAMAPPDGVGTPQESAGGASPPPDFVPYVFPFEPRERVVLPSRDPNEPRDPKLTPWEPYQQETIEEVWDQSEARQNPIPWGWFFLIALVLTGAGFWSLNRVRSAERNGSESAAAAHGVRGPEFAAKDEATELVERIEATLVKYFAAGDIEGLLGLSRDPARVEPLMRAYYAGKPVRVAGMKSLKTLRPLTLGKRADFWRASVLLEDKSSCQLVIEVLPSGEPKIDWETQVGYQPMPWDDFVTQRPRTRPMDFRVVVKKDNFFSHEFSDASQWACFLLTVPGSMESLFGYVPAGSSLEKRIDEIMRRNRDKPVNLILRLTFPEGIHSHRGVVIDQVISDGWVVIESQEAPSAFRPEGY